MVIGIAGAGVVGGVLLKWFKENTKHEIRLYDPPKDFNDSFVGCDAVFISVPVPPGPDGQDIRTLSGIVTLAKTSDVKNIFIRSTVLPGTNDRLGTISMPEFLTERTAYADFCRLPIIVGPTGVYSQTGFTVREIFPGKQIIRASNLECELSKYAHNCAGAVKVTYWNMIYELSRKLGADYETVRDLALTTGYIEKIHTQVPGPDGKRGYGGRCFPENMRSFRGFIEKNGWPIEKNLIADISNLNSCYRDHGEEVSAEANP